MPKSRVFMNETKVVVVEPDSFDTEFSVWVFDIGSNGNLVPSSSSESHSKGTLKNFLKFYGAVPIKKHLVLK